MGRQAFAREMAQASSHLIDLPSPHFLTRLNSANHSPKPSTRKERFLPSNNTHHLYQNVNIDNKIIRQSSLLAKKDTCSGEIARSSISRRCVAPISLFQPRMSIKSHLENIGAREPPAHVLHPNAWERFACSLHHHAIDESCPNKWLDRWLQTAQQP